MQRSWVSLVVFGVIGASVLYAALCVATLVQALAGRPFLGA